MVQRYLAGQLSTPTGIIGRFVLGPLWNRRNASLNEVTLAQLALSDGDRVLDIGFGGGYLLETIIPNVERGLAAGIDPSSVMVARCRARWREAIWTERVDIRRGVAEALPYPDGHFTRICSVNSIMYWSDAPQAAAEIFRVLRDTGQVVLTFTCKRDLERKWFAQYGVRPYDAREVERMLADVGFGQVLAVRDKDRHRQFICVTGRK